MKSHLDKYVRFCTEFQIDVFPITEWQLCRYACYYSNFVSSADTVANAVTALKTVNVLAGYPEWENSKLLKWVLKGLKKENKTSCTNDASDT